MKKRYYSAASLERGCLAYERQYGLSSADFYNAYTSGENDLDHIPRFHRHVWASFYRDSSASSGDLVFQVERTLELA